MNNVTAPIGQRSRHCRVLQVVGDPLGGVRKHVHDIIGSLDKSQFSSSYAYSTIHVDSQFQQEIPFIRNRLHGEIRLKVKKRPHPSDLVNLWKLVRFVKKNHVDIVHGHGAKGGLYARLVGVACRIPAIYTPHGGVAHRMFGFWEDLLYAAVERCLARVTHRFIFESHYTAESFLSKIGKNAQPWLINYSGISCPPIDVSRRTVVTAVRKETNIGVFGFLRPEKGQAYLIDAVASIVKSGHGNVRLHIFGNGPDRADLEQRVIQLEMTEKFHFYGDVPDPEHEMEKMDIIAIPSLFESFGYVGLEAMSLNKPVIASAVGGLREIFDSETALLVPPGDVTALARAITQCVDNPVFAAAMGQRGYQRCADHFSMKRMIETLSNQYRAAVPL